MCERFHNHFDLFAKANNAYEGQSLAVFHSLLEVFNHTPIIYFKLTLFILLISLSACSEKEEGLEQNKYPYSFIAQEDLADWDMGIQSDKGYILASSDEGDNSTTYLVKSYLEPSDGTIHFNAIDGTLMRFDANGSLEHILNKNFSINITKSENGYFVHWINSAGELCGATINLSSKSYIKFPSNKTRAGAASFFSPENLTTIIDWIQNLKSVYDFGNDLFTADIIGFLTDLSNFSTDLILGLAPQPLGISLTTLKGIIDGMNNSLYERQKKAMYGECKISIDEISNDGEGGINCHVSITQANTIPSHLYHLYYNEPENEARNIVKWGVVAKKSFSPRTNYYTEPFVLDERDLDTGNPNVQYFMISFPMPTDGEQYYFKAYLKSYRLADSNGKVNDNLVNYSNTYKYSTFDGYINGFTQLYTTVSNDNIVFNCSVSGTVKSLNDIVEWGFYYKDDRGQLYYYPSKYHIGSSIPSGISSPMDDVQQISISLNKSFFENNSYKEILLGLYTKGGFNLTYNGFSEPQHFYLEYNKKSDDDIIYHRNPFEFVDLGLSVKWASNNIGARSIGEPGYYLGWGETSQKANNIPYDAEHNIFGYPIKDKYGSVEWHYRSIGTSICGTNYDAAKIHWGTSCRMPSNKEAEELITKCRFITGKENGLSGRWAIGPNNHAIFLPSGGFTNPTLNDVKNHHYNARGWYWTGEISSTNYPYSGGSCSICEHFAGSFFVTTGMSSLGEEYGCSERCMGMNIRAVCSK